MRKRITILALLLAMSGLSSFAANNTYTYLREFNLTNAPGTVQRASTILGDSNGGIYFADNFSDRIFYIANPVTDDPTTDATYMVVYDASGDPFGNGSWQGLTFDGTDYYSTGRTNSSDVTSAIKITPNANPPTAWTTTLLTLADTGYSGPTAVASGKLVLTNFATGNLGFFTVGVSSLTLDGTVTGGAAYATMPVYDSASGTIFESVEGDSVCRGVQVFSSDGTLAGTSYSAGSNPLIDTVASSNADHTNQAEYYQEVTYEPVGKTLCVAQSSGSANPPGPPVFTLFDLTTPGTNMTPFFSIDGTDSVDGVFTTTTFPLGCAFFKNGGHNYLALSVERGPTSGSGQNRILIYQESGPAGVSDWLYY